MRRRSGSKVWSRFSTYLVAPSGQIRVGATTQGKPRVNPGLGYVFLATSGHGLKTSKLLRAEDEGKTLCRNEVFDRLFTLDIGFPTVEACHEDEENCGKEHEQSEESEVSRVLEIDSEIAQSRN